MPGLRLLFAAAVAAAPVLASRTRLDAAGGHKALAAGRVLRGRYRLAEQLQRLRPGYEPEDTSDFPWGQADASPLSIYRFADPEILGAGAYGVAWRARDLSVGRDVALKIFYVQDVYITREHIQQHAWVRHKVSEFASECGLVQAMLAENGSYPEGKRHVCGCLENHALDQEDAGDVSFLVLELCGESLLSKQKAFFRMGNADPRYLLQVRRWMRETLEALRFISGLGKPMAHMDLKQDNVLVTEAGEAKIIDFGLAAAYDKPHELSALAPRAPPEHFWHGGDVRTYPKEKAWAFDIWSWGAMYFDMLCRDDGGYEFFETDWEKPRLREKKAVDSCEDWVSKGIGEDLDWQAVQRALAPLESRASPAELMTLLGER